MDHSTLRQKLANYADGEHEPSQAASLAGLLNEDPDLQLEVERWRALRRCTQRAVHAEPVPDGLQARVRARLRAQTATPATEARPRFFRLGMPLSAVAAVLLLALVFWPGAGTMARAMDAGYFARHHLDCALGDRADSLRVRDGCDAQSFDDDQHGYARLASNASFNCDVPCLQACGYRLVGASEYTVGDRLRVVQAYFQCRTQGQILSIFVTSGPVALGGETRTVHAPDGHTHVYHTLQVDGVELVAWQSDTRTYVVCCGRLSTDCLIRLAESVRCATARPTTAPQP